MTQVQEKPAPGAQRANLQAITPHLVCAGAADAIDFYKKAFGAVETIRLQGKNGKLCMPQSRSGTQKSCSSMKLRNGVPIRRRRSAARQSRCTFTSLTSMRSSNGR